MLVTARMVAIVRRAKYGELTSGEPLYDPPITDAEVAEMRERLAQIESLTAQVDHEDTDPPGGTPSGTQEL